MAASKSTSKPERKSPAQYNELALEFISMYGHYRIVAKNEAKVPEPLSGIYTNKTLAEQAVNTYYKKK